MDIWDFVAKVLGGIFRLLTFGLAASDVVADRGGRGGPLDGYARQRGLEAAEHMLHEVSAARQRGQTYVYRISTHWKTTLLMILFLFVVCGGLGFAMGGKGLLLMLGIAAGVSVLVSLFLPPWPLDALRIDGRTVRLWRWRRFPFAEVVALDERTVFALDNLQYGTTDSALRFVGRRGKIASIRAAHFAGTRYDVRSCVQALIDMRDGVDPRARYQPAPAQAPHAAQPPAPWVQQSPAPPTWHR